MADSELTSPNIVAASDSSKGLVRILMVLGYLGIWIGFCFGGAGSFAWKRGWALTLLYVGTMGLSGVLMRRYNRGLMAARGKWKASNTQSFDLVFMALFLPLTNAQILVGSMDAVRFHWLPLDGWTLYAGAALFLLGMVLVNWTMLTNPFAETSVRVQSERGHRVITTGPYRLVRHPMYAGLLMLYPATGLLLGSGWALVVAAAIDLLVFWRTAREDRFLRTALPGYGEFAARTRYRLIPGLW